ncbi:MAG: hypothetical protein BWY20_01210 [Spirochaetes bacterium ADurb.Bin215]|nr:MAG: hypothetical protein BWY20_01210 [Spirochaetes bacterium ADurb.Bin215]
MNHHGEIYKYVGDEVIITWPEKKGARDANAVRVYQAIRRALVRKTDQYELKYGFSRFSGVASTLARWSSGKWALPARKSPFPAM